MKQNVNVLLIVCDQFRGDALSFANHPDVKTPYLDSLAADGVFFSHAYSATPSCIPARAALMTGRSQKRLSDAVHRQDACTSSKTDLRLSESAAPRRLSGLLSQPEYPALDASGCQ